MFFAGVPSAPLSAITHGGRGGVAGLERWGDGGLGGRRLSIAKW
jgi:hypothetical protein